MRSFRAALRARLPAVAAGASALCTASVALCEPDATFQRARVTGCKEVGSTRWLRLQTLSYEDATGRARKWDMATRTTRRGEVDAVAIVALLRRRASPEAVEMLLVQQFRPPVGAVTVELPAGLIDPGESPETAALRELKEETGYVGSAAYTSGKMSMSPGLCDETIQVCIVEVDLDAPVNQIPEQALEDKGLIKVARVPVGKLLPTLKKMESDGYVPFAGLYTLAIGLQMAAAGSFNSGALAD